MDTIKYNKKRSVWVGFLCALGVLSVGGGGLTAGWAIWHHKHSNSNDLSFKLQYDLSTGGKTFLQNAGDKIVISVILNNKEWPGDNMFGFWSIEGSAQTELVDDGYIDDAGGYVAEGSDGSGGAATWHKNDEGYWVGDFTITLKKNITEEIDPFSIMITLQTNSKSFSHNIMVYTRNSNTNADSDDFIGDISIPIVSSVDGWGLFNKNEFERSNTARTSIVSKVTTKVQQLVSSGALIMPTGTSSVAMFTNFSTFGSMMNTLGQIDNPSSFFAMLLMENCLSLAEEAQRPETSTALSASRSDNIGYTLTVNSLSYSGLDGSNRLMTGSYEQKWSNNSDTKYYTNTNSATSTTNNDTYVTCQNANGSYLLGNSNVNWSNGSFSIAQFISYQAPRNAIVTNNTSRAYHLDSFNSGSEDANFQNAFKTFLHVIYPNVAAFS